MVELYDGLAVIDASNPDVKVCLINGALERTTPEMATAIERYLSEWTRSTLDQAGAIELKAYRNGILGSQMLIKDGTCASPSDDSIRYRGVSDVRTFWLRTGELQFAGLGFVYAPDPGVRNCQAEAATSMTTPEMKTAIERFLADKTKANMDAYVAAEKKAYPDGVIASAQHRSTARACLDKETDKTLARLANVPSRHAFLEETIRMGNEQRGRPVEFVAPDLVDCIATAQEKSYSTAYLSAVDRFVGSKTRANWDAITAAYPPFSSSGAQTGLDRASYACNKQFAP